MMRVKGPDILGGLVTLFWVALMAVGVWALHKEQSCKDDCRARGLAHEATLLDGTCFCANVAVTRIEGPAGE